MTKRILSGLIAVLITLTALFVTPLSASAETVIVNETNVEPTSADQPMPSSPAATDASVTEPPDDADEEPVSNDYPCITDFQNQRSGTQITWDTYKDNQLYRIYYRKAASTLGTWDDKYADGVWTRLATVRGNSYLHTTVNDAEIGIYTVRCVDSGGNFTSDFNDKGWENCYYAAPTFTSMIFDEDGVHLSWDQSWQKHGFWDGETYRVYRRTADTGWTRLEQTTDDHYTDATAEPGTTYYYTLRMIDSMNTRFLSDFVSSSPVSFNAYPYVYNIENQSGGAQLSWYRYSGAATYRVYYRSSDSWIRIAQVSGTSFTDTAVKNAVERVYTVRAMDARNDFISDFNTDGWNNTYYAPPVIESLSNTTEGVKLTWNRSDGAQAYRVYRKTNSGWLRLEQTEGCEFTDTNVVSGIAYTYTLRMVTSDGERFMSDFLSGKRITYVAAPVITDAVNQANGVKLTWEPVAGASYYRIYYRTDNGWKRLASKYLTEYVDTTVKDGETREYTVRCLDKDDNFVSDFYHNGYLNTFHEPPVIKSLSGSAGDITITWDRAADAEDYRVYRKTAGSSWRLLTQTSESSYTDTGYVKGVVNYYTLRMITADGSRFMSDFIVDKKILWCDTPRFSSLTNDDNGVILSWNTVKGADRYRVYYRDGSDWIRMSTVSGTFYTDASVMDGQSRVYTIRAVDAGGTFISDFDPGGVSHTYYSPARIDTLSYGNNAYTIRWTTNSNAASYRLYRKTLGDSDWTMIADHIEGNAFTDDSVTENGIFAYTIRALDENGTIIDSSVPDDRYYRNGDPANGTFTVGGTDYHLSSGSLINGYYTEKGYPYYYRDGVRVEQGWFKNGVYAGAYNRTQWLFEVMSLIGEAPSISRYDSKAVFDLAIERGIIDSYSDNEFFLSVNRRFAAITIVNALGYPTRTAITVSDIGKNDSALSTLAFYGYFLLDSKDRIFPEASVTPNEFDSLLSQLYLYRQLKGKTVLSFGDSIMHGKDNNIMPFSNCIAEKYGMSCVDYSADGSTMGRYTGKIHIADQVRKAIAYRRQPDIILIDGGTNDMYRGVELGRFQSGYDMTNANEDTFTGGFEKALWLIRNTWKDVPVIYIRVHNTGLGVDSHERTFGERGIAVAEKWNVGSIDLYKGSSFNAEIEYYCNRYTYRNPTHNYTPDSIHPNALGYATFYIAPVDKMISYTVNK